jgi:HK97 family phage major capsid protein
MKNHREISAALQELSALTNKPSWSKREERRHAFLLSAISVMKSNGEVSLLDLERDEFNEESRAQGLPTVNFRNSSMPREKENEIRAWQAIIAHGTESIPEFRDMTVGSLVAQLGTYTGLGSFVPTGFYNEIFQALKHVDFLFDPDCVTMIRTSTGNPLPIPLMSDTENQAALAGEGAPLTEADITLTSHVTLGAYNFKSPYFVASIESFQDVEGAMTILELFKSFASSRWARAVGKYLVGGSGINQPSGLLTQLSALNAPTVVASGSSTNDGSSNTGVNSIGTDDLANMIQQLDPLYLASKKCFFGMNMNTFTSLLRLKDKYGRTLVDFVDGARQIFGIPIRIAPNLPNIGSASYGTIVLGDYSFFATRLVNPLNDFGFGDGVSVSTERYSELGKVGLRFFGRADGAVLWDGDSNSPCPFVVLQQHS